MSNVVNEAATGIQDVQAYAGFDGEEKRIQAHIKQLYHILKRLFLIKYGIKFSRITISWLLKSINMKPGLFSRPYTTALLTRTILLMPGSL